MVKKEYLFFFILLFLITFISAQDPIGKRQDAQIGEVYYISQPCATCSYINISVFNKNGIVLDNVEMINNGSTWIYPFTPNNSLRYDVNGIGDKDGVNDSFAFWFDATLSGEQNNIPIIISNIVLLLSLLGLLSFVLYKHKKTDFESWDKNIVNNHKNMGQTLVNGFVYSLFKNSFIWVYFIVWLFILVLKDVIYRFNSAEIYSYFTLIANIYSLGLLLVVIFMIGFFTSYIRKTIETLSNKNWGLE